MSDLKYNKHGDTQKIRTVNVRDIAVKLKIYVIAKNRILNMALELFRSLTFMVRIFYAYVERLNAIALYININGVISPWPHLLIYSRG